MRIRKNKEKSSRASLFLLAGFFFALIMFFAGNKAVLHTSSDRYCASCHVHPQATKTWNRSIHADNKSGIKVHCVQCHLPPHGKGYLREKIKTGVRDVWSHWFRDAENINWDTRSRPEIAIRHVYESSCTGCHANLFPKGLSREGEDAHLHYEEHSDELHCIKCHIGVGHYDPETIHAANVAFGKQKEADKEIYTQPARPQTFKHYTETVPGTTVSFDMIAVPGGTFMMGSPENEPFRDNDEGPQRKVKVDSFYMGKYEVTWTEYLAFYRETAAQGKTADAYLNRENKDVDAISGPTAPWGDPGQGWGKADRPAITMTWHAAETYCKWLSQKTGKKYRLPTEAEWEYAARGGTIGPYFFDGDPRKFAGSGLLRKISGPDTSVIGRYVVYRENSNMMTHPVGEKKPNPFGLVNMLGNVAEFCMDRYTPVATSGVKTAGTGGVEHVVRGGSYRSAAGEVRCAARDHTQTTAWLKTDPQIPKSIWWYSDCNWVGFRVVCEPDFSKNNNY